MIRLHNQDGEETHNGAIITAEDKNGIKWVQCDFSTIDEVGKCSQCGRQFHERGWFCLRGGNEGSVLDACNDCVEVR